MNYTLTKFNVLSFLLFLPSLFYSFFYYCYCNFWNQFTRQRLLTPLFLFVLRSCLSFVLHFIFITGVFIITIICYCCIVGLQLNPAVYHFSSYPPYIAAEDFIFKLDLVQFITCSIQYILQLILSHSLRSLSVGWEYRQGGPRGKALV